MAALGGTPCQGPRSGAAARCSVSGSQRPTFSSGWPLPACNGPRAARWQRKRDPRCSSASDAALSLGLSARASVQLQPAPEQQRVVPRRSWASLSDAEDDAMDDAAPPPPPRAAQTPLKINTDLRLYRARLARMMSNLAADNNERRRLLRESEAGLRLCLDTDPTDPRAYVSLGRILLQQKRYDEARKLYADGTSNTGNTNPYIWAAWGYLEYRAGDVSRARKLFDAAIVVDETHAAAWHKWGMLEMRQGNFLRARDLWTRGIQKCRRAPQKSNTYLYCSLAVMAAELGKLGEARSWFEEGTRTNLGKASCALWHAWAMVEARIGDPAAVRFLFKRSLQANPASRYAYLAWAMWERKLGNGSAATQLLARGQALNPADPALFQARAMVAREAGRLDEAAAVFAAGLKVDPSHLHLWQAWGVMEFQRGRLEEARRLFQEGVWADSGNRDVVYVFQAWGVLEWKGTRNHQLARELFKAALKVDPRNESTWGTWIAMEEELGRLEAANDLRIRRGEQQWEFVIPSSFTTRPPGGGGDEHDAGGEGGGGAAALGPLNGILASINRFFRARGEGGGGGGRAGGSRSLADMLPEDFLKEGDAGGVAGLAAELLAGAAVVAPDGGGAAAAVAVGGQQQQQQQQQHGEQRHGAHEQQQAASPQQQQQQQRRRTLRQQEQQQRQQRVAFPDGSQGAQRSAVSRLTKRPTRPAAPQPGQGGGGGGGAAAGLAAVGSSRSSSSGSGSDGAEGGGADV